MLWELAKRYLLNLVPQFAAIDKKKKLDKNEFIRIIEFIKNDDKLIVKDGLHSQKMIDDETIDKIYCKNELLEEYLPLVFIYIGIQALRYENDFDHAVLGQKILEKEIQKYIIPPPNFINSEFDIKKMDL